MPRVFNSLTDVRGTLVYGGEASSDFGMVVREAPSFERAKRKQTIYTVPGRNGSVVMQEDAWEDTVRSYKVWLDEAIEEDSGGNISGTLAERVDAFEAMLNSKNGYQKLTDNFEPDIYRLAYYSGGDSFTNELMIYGNATLNFTCKPQRFLASGDTAESVTNGSTLNNPTRFASKPLIYIKVPTAGTVAVAFGGNTITANVTDYIYIDCEDMNAYRLATENKNSEISGAFPNLQPGNNTIGITGTITKVEITPRYFTI